MDPAVGDQCRSMDGNHPSLHKEQKGVGEIENAIWNVFPCGLSGHYQKWFIFFQTFFKKVLTYDFYGAIVLQEGSADPFLFDTKK